MATRTAPTVDGSPSYVAASFRLIDASGDKRSFQLKLPAAATAAQIEAVAASLAAATNASLYAVEVTEAYAGAINAGNASEVVHESVYDNIVILFKDTSGVPVSQNGFIPAPNSALVEPGDDIDTSNALYTAFRDAVATALAGGYAAITARYTERREKNDSVPA
jgi:hypothetical protein